MPYVHKTVLSSNISIVSFFQSIYISSNHRDSFPTLLQWSLVCRYKYINNFFTTVMMVGILVGASVFGHLADLYGRRHVLYGSVVLLLLSLYLQGLSANWQMFVALRFTGGMAVGE